MPILRLLSYPLQQRLDVLPVQRHIAPPVAHLGILFEQIGQRLPFHALLRLAVPGAVAQQHVNAVAVSAERGVVERPAPPPVGRVDVRPRPAQQRDRLGAPVARRDVRRRPAVAVAPVDVDAAAGQAKQRPDLLDVALARRGYEVRRPAGAPERPSRGPQAVGAVRVPVPIPACVTSRPNRSSDETEPNQTVHNLLVCNSINTRSCSLSLPTKLH